MTILTKKEMVESVANKLTDKDIENKFTKDFVKVKFAKNIHFEIYPTENQLGLYIHIESTNPEIAHEKFFNLIAKNPQLLKNNIYASKDQNSSIYELITSIKELNQRKWYGIELFNINKDDETAINQVIGKLIEYMEKIK